MEKSKRIYRIKGVDSSELADWHIKYMEMGMLDNTDSTNYTSIPTIDSNASSVIFVSTQTASTQRKNTSILRDKYTHLIHTIINRTFENGGRNHSITLNSSVLQSVYGKDYHLLLKVLWLRKILPTIEDNHYTIASKSYEYILSSGVDITYTMEFPTYLSKYSSAMIKAIDKYNVKEETKNKENLNDNKLYNDYNASLRLLTMPYVKEANEFISMHHFSNEYSKQYYDNIIYKYTHNKFQITQIDNNKRIYHIGTQTPRLLKSFLNIKFSCDIHNSHPLLFNYIIYQYLNISQSTIFSISSIIPTLNIPPHNVSRFIRKSLIDNGIEKNEIANVPTDILSYIYLTSKGVFWDCIVDDSVCRENSLLRSDIKVLMFAEVFYSKKLTSRGKEYAKLFYSKFPSIRKVIKSEKTEDRTRLANEMMRLESELFHKVLKKLYSKRFRVISIHDAIVVIDTKANKDCTEELVSNIIKEVYAKWGLSPTVAVDYYGKDYMEKVLNREKELNEKITTYLNELKEQASSGNMVSAEILSDIENGKYELVFNADCTDIVLHPVDFHRK